MRTRPAPRRPIGPVAAFVALAMLGAALATRAAVVQGGDPATMGLVGAASFGLIGVGAAAGRVSPWLAGATLGAVASLTFFACLPCDGSTIAMPMFGAALGSLVGFLSGQAVRAARQGVTPSA